MQNVCVCVCVCVCVFVSMRVCVSNKQGHILVFPVFKPVFVLMSAQPQSVIYNGDSATNICVWFELFVSKRNPCFKYYKTFNVSCFRSEKDLHSLRVNKTPSKENILF
jgi:hypothetical protein